ncbi:hypothetical protein EMIHUDRAFT_445208, partial [Emiliania huxleyi CCMP1516]|uniref:Uncharacterized protein n=2 Tax=Emiliania huxleyi TaxID=2903 RepID=A0A0D3J200_EMIH1
MALIDAPPAQQLVSPALCTYSILHLHAPAHAPILVHTPTVCSSSPAPRHRADGRVARAARPLHGAAGGLVGRRLDRDAPPHVREQAQARDARARAGALDWPRAGRHGRAGQAALSHAQGGEPLPPPTRLCDAAHARLDGVQPQAAARAAAGRAGPRRAKEAVAEPRAPRAARPPPGEEGAQPGQVAPSQVGEAVVGKRAPLIPDSALRKKLHFLF